MSGHQLPGHCPKRWPSRFRRAFIVLPGWALRGQHCRVEIPLTNATWASDLPLFPFRLTRPPQITDQTARHVQGLGKVPDKHPFQASCRQPWIGQENTVLPVLSLKEVSMSEWVEFGPFRSQAVRPTKLIMFAFPRAYSWRLPCVGEGALALHSSSVNLGHSLHLPKPPFLHFMSENNKACLLGLCLRSDSYI